MRRQHETMSWVVARQHFVVMQRAADGTRALLYAVAHGRLVERAAAHGITELAAFAAAVDARLRDPHVRSLQPQDVDGTIILAAWLRAHGERDGYIFPLGDAAPAQGQLPEWTAALESLLAQGAVPDADPAQLPAPTHPQC